MYQLSLFEEVKKVIGNCNDCIYYDDNQWYKERYGYCTRYPTSSAHFKCTKEKYYVIHPNDKGCGLFNYKSND